MHAHSVLYAHPPGKLPKKYDPTVKPDPERWLPRFERSDYKRKHKKRVGAVGKGTQGSATARDGCVDVKAPSDTAIFPTSIPVCTAVTLATVLPSYIRF